MAEDRELKGYQAALNACPEIPAALAQPRHSNEARRVPS